MFFLTEIGLNYSKCKQWYFDWFQHKPTADSLTSANILALIFDAKSPRTKVVLLERGDSLYHFYNEFQLTVTGRNLYRALLPLSFRWQILINFDSGTLQKFNIRAKCPTCNATGSITCHSCQGATFRRKNRFAALKCSTCSQKGFLPCPDCLWCFDWF